MLLENLLVGNATEMVFEAVKALYAKYSTDEKIAPKVEKQFKQAVEAGSKAFARHLEAHIALAPAQAEAISAFFETHEVAFEFSKLLDPGQEYFDEGELSSMLHRFLEDRSCDSIPQGDLMEAWKAFARAFSFASRSANELREFLRASYEAGSFRAISNISEVMDRLWQEMETLSEQEQVLSTSLNEYTGELRQYADWAKHFTRSH